MNVPVKKGMQDAAAKAGVPVRVQRLGSMLTVFFANEEIVDWPSAAKADRGLFGKWHRALLDEGVYWPPAQFEAAFVSTAHTEADIDRTAAAAATAFQAVRAS